MLGNRSRDNVGDLEGAARCYARSRELFDRLAADGHGGRVRLDAAVLRAHMAEYAMDAGDLELTLEHYDAFLGVYDDPTQSDNRSIQRWLAQSLSKRGQTLGAGGDHQGAPEHFERSLEIYETLLGGGELEEVDLQLEATLVRSQIGTARLSGGDEAGLEDIRAAYDELARQSAGDAGSTSHRRYLVDTSALLSSFLIRRRSFDEAERVLDLGISEAER